MKNKLLRVQNLNKSFGEVKVLKNINFDVQEKEVVVILGKSGCGKSTLLRCLNLLEKIDGGKIYLDDILINDKKINLSYVRQKIGMVFQDYELFPHMNVLENIILAPTLVQKVERNKVIEIAKKLLDKFSLLEKIKSYPKELSGGQKQRVAIIRALIMNPVLMLFDEVTAALDPEMVREVLDTILKLAKDGMTMLIVTHEIRFAKAIADRVVFMHLGEIIENSNNFFSDPKTEISKKFLSTLNS
ncbi:MAG: amino acid ABC transporter ATP-binding protein [Clostridiales bacterium]|nr:amino acid ABC transporter ATP-binding protein [Clostridiales bacterium]